jgi:hypothetical protein
MSVNDSLKVVRRHIPAIPLFPLLLGKNRGFTGSDRKCMRSSLYTAYTGRQYVTCLDVSAEGTAELSMWPNLGRTSDMVISKKILYVLLHLFFFSP